MYGIMMGKVYISVSRTGQDSTNGRGAIRPFWVHMWFFSLCKIRKLYLYQIVSTIKRLSSVFPSFCSLFCQPMFFMRGSFHFVTSVLYWLPSDYQGPRGTARNDKSLKSFISGAAPRNPMAPPLETPWRRPSKPLRRPSKPHGAVPRNPRCAAPQNPWGQNLRPKFSSFGGF